MNIRWRDWFFIGLIRLIDMMQGSVLKNYSVFSFLVGHASQTYGAKACWYRAIKEFLIAYKKVPAYQEFLQEKGWSPKTKDAKEIFLSLPVMDKPNYILPYPIEARCLNGEFFQEGVVIDESSGSTGVPLINLIPDGAEK